MPAEADNAIPKASVAASEPSAEVSCFNGTIAPRELMSMLRLMNKAQVSGAIRCVGTAEAGGEAKALIHLRQGQVRAAFYTNGQVGELSGAAALTRAVLISGVIHFESITATPPRNITHETSFLLDSIAKVLAEVDRAKQIEVAIPVLEAKAQDAPVGSITEKIEAFHAPQIGDVIGKCKLLRQIGQGASSLVYLAHHQSLDVDVVVKVLMNEGARSHHRALTVNEAQLLARLNHPNIVRLYDFDDSARHPHLVVEFIDGPSLSDLLRQRVRLDVDEALPLFAQVAEALAYGDGQLGLVHCDLKPENILLTTGMQAKLADFGLAKARSRNASMPPMVPADVVVGTPSYIAPEQVRGGHAGTDKRSDIYSLGATFFHVFTGRPPFIDEDPIQLMLKRLDSDAPMADQLVPGLDRRISALLATMLARDPARRLADYDELLVTINDILESRDRRDTNATATGTAANVIRRRISFWRSVPNRLFGT